MTPVMQTQVSQPGVKGNCFAACVASILEIPIEDAFDCWKYTDEDWHDEFKKWLYERGLDCVALWELPVGVFGIANGQSPRGVSGGHSVIWKDGQLAHDPHPDGGGLTGDPEYYYLIEKIAN